MGREADVPLLCLPFAGAGASFFYPWRNLAVSDIDVIPVHLPGRERLLAEEPYTDLHTAADGLLPIALESAGDRPLALFGHCFLGAVLAYELARRIVPHGRERVLHLFVSAAPTPTSVRHASSAGLPDDEFLDLVQQTTGYRHPSFEIPESRELLLPALR